MNLRYFKQKIRPEHWEEFQQLTPERFRVKNNDFTEVGKYMAISPENQMSAEAAYEYAAEVIFEKYEYYSDDEEFLY